MRWTNALIPTLKEDPQDAEAVSHKLMVRTGLIRKLSAGVYSYLPLGFKVLNKVITIVREEMNAKGAEEVLLPAIQPIELWERTGRIKDLGEDMITFVDRHNKRNVLGPTHEEVITDLVANNVKSYKDLPLTLYQIQTKFRDEPRPRFGVIRSREFIMKDAYSFDTDVEGLDVSYKKMYDAYCAIFERCGLKYIPVEADTGVMGGDVSHEFMVPSENGEDIIVMCKSCGYAASVAVAAVVQRVSKASARGKPAPMKEVDTPGVSTIDKVSKMLGRPPEKLIKTLIYTADDKPVAVLIRGDHQANEAKIKRLLKCQKLQMADDATIRGVTGGPVGFSGPIGLKGVSLIADYALKDSENFAAGANKQDKHLIDVNVDRDFKVDIWADLRYITDKDTCPKCSKEIGISHAIEIGHTFKLGTKYSSSLGAKYLDKSGTRKDIIMGCYGIGINRIVASAIEVGNDKNGIIWPAQIAPYRVLVMPLNMADKKISDTAEMIYKKLYSSGIDVLLDDRDQRAGFKFKDADLLGIPVQIIVGQKLADEDAVEVKRRSTGKTVKSSIKDIEKTVDNMLNL